MSAMTELDAIGPEDILSIETSEVMLVAATIDFSHHAAVIQAIGPAAGRFLAPRIGWFACEKNISCGSQLYFTDHEGGQNRFVPMGTIKRIAYEYAPEKVIKLLTNFILWEHPRAPMRVAAERASLLFEVSRKRENQRPAFRRKLLDLFRQGQ